ncbi:MAG TPA: SUMF1/EgtB/PvdO family nonheme iron enzyme [Fimbriiglobus sp.]|jgi:formylglycine-generating enzyme required for sulfatase activity|nr:SUMF1/EgtB/PvdO family nonheme iron enzyme [Fimbriiglobus sp.]
MTLRSTAPAFVIVCLAALVGVASPQEPEVKQVIPPTPDVPVKVNLPAKNFTETLPGDVKFEMVYVPGGEFVMGSPESEPGHQPDEGPQHKVRVKPFWLAKCEVTWEEYYDFWKDEGLFKTDEVPQELQANLKPDAITKPTNTYVDELYDHGKEGHPAICMTHHAAMMYCHWLRWKTKKGYRLPTEAEWEFACRAGRTGPYGFDEKTEKLEDHAWLKANSASEEHSAESQRKDNGDPTTHKVGTKKPNKYGLHDMHGNVWEWCLDYHDPKFYAKFPADVVTLGPVNRPTDKKWSHTVRGGSWADKADRLRSAARRGSDKSWMKHDPQLPQSIWWLTRMDVVGFRVALPVEEYPELVGIKPMVVKKVD